MNRGSKTKLLKSPVRETGRSKPRGQGLAALISGLCLLLAGCAGISPQGTVLTPPYRPENVFVWSPTLPSEVKRVAVLPLACDRRNADLVEGREALEPVVQAELIKTRRFEVLSAQPETLRIATGRADWTEEEVLPVDFLRSLSSVYGCDAVLFCQLTVFRAYAPVAVGWRMRLVDTRTHNTLWAADEIFDAGKPGVVSGAHAFRVAEVFDPAKATDDWALLHSPRKFGQYAAARLLATLPPR